MMQVMGEPDDDAAVDRHTADPADHAADLLALYDRAIDEVYRYLHTRCGGRQLAEDLCADTFLAAVGQIQRGAVDQVTVAWLIGIARHKLVDHWRRVDRRREAATDDVPDVADAADVWDVTVDRHQVETVMAELGPHHRSALVLRYFDGLPVPDVAEHLGRTVHATEALLVRARRQFRTTYEARHGGQW
jgi:RNA polymerase sigma-70 factor, ECF subfamily